MRPSRAACVLLSAFVFAGCAERASPLVPFGVTTAVKQTKYVSGYENVGRAPNEIVFVKTTVTVPPTPRAVGTVFEWPGIQPFKGPTFRPIGNGVLQPVLSWGPSCAPGNQPPKYSTWWISAQYVNTFGHYPGFTGCHGGKIMPVAVGDSLVETLTLKGSTWKQSVLDKNTHKSVHFSIDLGGQRQQIFRVERESYGQAPSGPIVYTDTSFTFLRKPKDGCALIQSGTPDSRDSYSTPVVSGNGLTCRIATITLYAPSIRRKP